MIHSYTTTTTFFFFFPHVRCQDHNWNNLIIQWQARTFKPWNVAVFTTISWWISLHCQAVKTDLWFLNTAIQNSNTQMHVSSHSDSCIMEKYLHIHLAVPWRYHNKFHAFMATLKRNTTKYRKLHWLFPQWTYQCYDMVSYRNPFTSPQIQLHYHYFKNPVWLCSGLFQFLWQLIQ